MRNSKETLENLRNISKQTLENIINNNKYKKP